MAQPQLSFGAFARAPPPRPSRLPRLPVPASPNTAQLVSDRRDHDGAPRSREVLQQLDGRALLPGSAPPDLFISHASEDKEQVARPLAAALRRRGWTVWLDELELTVGDSLNGRIEQGLASSRFGVVVLSPNFFAKPWPQKELAGLAAREVSGGSKVILPVWHEIDQQYIVARAPTLADRLGVSTSGGVDMVADEIGRALRAATTLPRDAGVEPLLQPAIRQAAADSVGRHDAAIEQGRLIAERPDLWEVRLFASVLREGRAELEPKWRDNALHLGGGVRCGIDEGSVVEHCRREVRWVHDQCLGLMRLFSPAAQTSAFGPPGEHGDPVWVEHLAHKIIGTYADLLDASASLRQATVPDAFRELRDVTAEFMDEPIRCIRDFIDDVLAQMARVPELLARYDDAEPVKLTMTLTITADPAVTAKLDGVLVRLERRTGGGGVGGEPPRDETPAPWNDVGAANPARIGGLADVVPDQITSSTFRVQRILSGVLRIAAVVYRHPVRTLTVPWLALACAGAALDSESALLETPWAVLFLANAVVIAVKFIRWTGTGRRQGS